MRWLNTFFVMEVLLYDFDSARSSFFRMRLLSINISKDDKANGRIILWYTPFPKQSLSFSTFKSLFSARDDAGGEPQFSCLQQHVLCAAKGICFAESKMILSKDGYRAGCPIEPVPNGWIIDITWLFM